MPDDTLQQGDPERIAKRMARAGLCSRREAETWILAGRVKLNGKVLDTPAVKVTDHDYIEVGAKTRPERTDTTVVVSQTWRHGYNQPRPGWPQDCF